MVMVINMVLKIITYVLLMIFNFVQKEENINVVNHVILFIQTPQIGELKMMTGVLFHIHVKKKKKKLPLPLPLLQLNQFLQWK